MCTNHVQFQLPAWVLNVWLGSYSIHLVIQITTNQWYYTSLLWIKKNGTFIMWYHILGIAFSVSNFSEWIRLACSKVLSIRWNISSRLYFYLHSFISHYLPRDWQSMLTHVTKRKVFYFTQIYFNVLLNPYILNIYNTYKN